VKEGRAAERYDKKRIYCCAVAAGVFGRRESLVLT